MSREQELAAIWVELYRLRKRLGRAITSTGGGGSGSITDGDYGDISVSSTGTVFTIDPNVVTYSKFQDVGANSYLGRSSTSSGDVGEIALTGSQLAGRGSTGNITAITLGTGLSMSGDTLNAAGSGGGGGSTLIYPDFTTPVDGDYTWVNQGGASVTVNANGSIYLLAPLSGTDNIRIRKKAKTTYPVTIAYLPFLKQSGTNSQSAGMVLRESGSGKLITWTTLNNVGTTYWSFWYQRWNSPTSFNANTASQIMLIFPGMVWLQYDEDGSNRYFRYSLDGYNFIEVYSETKTNFITVDEVGFSVMENTNEKPAAMTLYSFAP